jgi:hypothetical protein
MAKYMQTDAPGADPSLDDDDSRARAGIVVSLVKWILGGEDPGIWTENLTKLGSTNTCNYVSFYNAHCNETHATHHLI